MKKFFIIVGLALLGLILSVYLSAQYYQSLNPKIDDSGVCISPDHSCDDVKKSDYGQLFGLPVSTWGALYFLILILIVFLSAQDILNFENSKKLLYFIGAGGFGFSIYFLYIMFFVLKSVCPTCFASHIINFVMLGVTYFHTKTSDKMI